MNISHTFDAKLTREWWLRCIADDTKMTLWLQKLQRTELGGYSDHVEFMKTHTITERDSKILNNIATDELKHSIVLCSMFKSRGVEVKPEGEQSTYWDEVLAGVTTVEEYYAANYYGEALASYRFEVIQSMPETPSDIKEALRIILPDEIFHRETLMRLCSEETLNKYGKIHIDAYNKLTRK